MFPNYVSLTLKEQLYSNCFFVSSALKIWNISAFLFTHLKGKLCIKLRLFAVKIFYLTDHKFKCYITWC